MKARDKPQLPSQGIWCSPIWLDWLANQFQGFLLGPTSPVLELKAQATIPRFYVGSGDLSSGPSFSAYILPTESFLPFLEHFLNCYFPFPIPFNDRWI